MIFVTVGTHEQGFNRLITELDLLVKNNEIKDQVIIQHGYTTYQPQYCTAQKFIPAQDMESYMETADLVISHGGPATYMTAISKGTPTIVVPRLSRFNEHVNDHQLDFANKINATSDYNLTIITEISELKATILDKLASKSKSSAASSHTDVFVSKFSNLLESLL